jgi:hypothetical protein
MDRESDPPRHVPGAWSIQPRSTLAIRGSRKQGDQIMRMFKPLGVLIAMLAIAAIATASASAEVTLWKFLPGKVGETFKGGGGKATLQQKGGSSLNCKKFEIKAKGGELIEEGATEGEDATLALAVVEFTGCTAFGLFSAHSLGSAKGVIRTRVKIHTCLIAPDIYGLLIEPLPLHIEVDTVNELTVITGSFIAQVTPEGAPAKLWSLNIKQAGGEQEIGKCEGGTSQTLVSENQENGTQLQSGELVSEGFIEFEKEAQEAMV